MTDSTDNARGPERIAHPYKGPDLPTEVFADPGRHDWYFREKMPDSVARFVRADLAPDPLADPRVVALVEALEQIAGEAQVPVQTWKNGINFKKMYEGWRKIATTRIDIARAALAALSPTGGNADG